MSESQISEAQNALCTILGELHCIEADARMIEKWHTNPNLNVPERAQAIKRHRDVAFAAAVKAIESLNALENNSIHSPNDTEIQNREL
jgi:hypothetical protein